MSSDHTPVVGPAPRTPEWYDARRTHFGASEAEDVVMQPLKIYARKVRGEEEPDNDAMMVGRHVEPAIGSLYEETTGVAPLVGEQPMFFHPDIKYLAATPDFAGPDNLWVEAKYSMSPAIAMQLGEPGSDEIPTRWMWQTQQQMDVLEADWIDVAVLVFGRFKVYRATRNDRLITALHRSADELWDRIQTLCPPDPKPNPGALEAAKAAFDWQEDVVVDLDEETLGFWVQCQAAKDEAKRAQDQANYLQSVVLARLGDAAAGRFPQGEFELRRTKVKDQLWTPGDIVSAEQRQGQVKRKGHIRLGQKKVK